MPAEVDRLRRISLRLDQKLLRLVEELDGLKEQLKESEKKNGETSKQVDGLSEQLERRAVEVHTLETEKKALREQIDKLEVLNRKLQGQYSKVKEQLVFEQEVLKQGETSNDPKDIAQRNKMLELTLVKLREESLDNELKLNEKLNTVTDQANTLTKENEEMKGVVKDSKGLKELNAELEAKLKGLQSSEDLIERLTIKNDSLLSRNQHLTKNVKELENLETVNQQLIDNHSMLQNDLKQEIDKLREKLADRERRIDDLQVKIKKLDQVILRQKSDEPSRRGSSISSLDPGYGTWVIEANDLSSRWYTEFLGSFVVDTDSSKLGIFKRLIELSTLTSYFYDRYMDRMKLKSSEADSRHFLSMCNNLSEAGALAHFLIEVYKYKRTNIPDDILSKVSAYCHDFVQLCEMGQPQLTVDIESITCDKILRNRELSIFKLSKLVSKLELAGIAVKQSQEFARLRESAGRIVSRLIEMRNPRMGLGAVVETEESELVAFLDHVISVFSQQELREADTVFDEEIVKSIRDSLDKEVLRPVQIYSPQLWQKEERPPPVAFRPLSVPADKLPEMTARRGSAPSSPQGTSFSTSKKMQVDELTLKVSVLQARLKKLSVNEQKLSRADNSLKSEKSMNTALNRELNELRSNHSTLQKRVVKMHSLLTTFGLNQMASEEEVENKAQVHTEFRKIDRNRMINEITKQRDLIMRLSAEKPKEQKYEWLADLPTSKLVENSKPREAIDKLFELNNKYGVMPIDSQSNMTTSRYYLNRMEEDIVRFLVD